MPDIVVIVRHGSYDPDTMDLDAQGISDLHNVGSKLQDTLLYSGKSVAILTSDIHRAIRTGEVLREFFPHSPSSSHVPVLYSAFYPAINALIEKSEAHILILVTHYELCDYHPFALSPYYFEKPFRTSTARVFYKKNGGTQPITITLDT